MTEDETDAIAVEDETDALFDDESIDENDDMDDPFARLDEDAPGEDEHGDGADAEAPGAEDPLFVEAKTGTETEAEAGDRDPVDTGTADDAFGSRSAADAGRTGTDDPFDELGPATGDADADLDEAFERMDVGDLTDEDIWKSLDEDTESGVGSVGEFGDVVSETDTAGSGLEGRVGAGGRFADAGVERVISKRTYCQQCPHFSAPPTVACGHEGTTIVEAVGFDEFRVRNCPMVDDDDSTFDATRGE